MGRYVFVPLTDEILYEHPELINGPLVPYSTEAPCCHWLSVEINPVEPPPRKRFTSNLPRPVLLTPEIRRPRSGAYSY